MNADIIDFIIGLPALEAICQVRAPGNKDRCLKWLQLVQG